MKKPMTCCSFGKGFANTSVGEKKEKIPLGEIVRNGEGSYKPVMLVVSSRKSVDQYVVDMPSSLDQQSSDSTSEKTPYSEDSPSLSDAQTSVKSSETVNPDSVTNFAQNSFQGSDAPHTLPAYSLISRPLLDGVQQGLDHDRNLPRLSSSQPDRLPNRDATNRQPVASTENSKKNVIEAASISGTTGSSSAGNSRSDIISGSSHTTENLPAQANSMIEEELRSGVQCDTTACDTEISSPYHSASNKETKELELGCCEQARNNSENPRSVVKVSQSNESHHNSVQGRNTTSNSGDKNQKPVNVGMFSLCSRHMIPIMITFYAPWMEFGDI